MVPAVVIVTRSLWGHILYAGAFSIADRLLADTTL
jgi:hypothetical protein